MRTSLHRVALAAAMGLAVGACQGEPLETRTFEVQYLRAYEVEPILAPYVYTDREGNPGMMSLTDAAVTVRETEDNLAKIERVLEEYDRPRPTVMLHFQIIEADGATGADPAIAEVEAELRRLFRFEGYELLAEAQVGGIQGTDLRQLVSAGNQEEAFLIRGGVSEVRTAGASATVTVDVQLHTAGSGPVLETSVTIPVSHSVVLGTANASGFDGALILVVRAEVMQTNGAAGSAPDPT